jgi:fumarylacetoacetate (FAA) hydrolase
MIKEFDEYPIFYFTNHNAVQGPGPIYCMPDHFQQLDFELEIAIVIGKEGKNIKAKDDKVHYSLIQHQISQSIIYFH